MADYPIYEVTASSLNLPSAVWRAESGDTSVEAGPNRLHPMQYEANYGLINVDWESRKAELKVVSPQGGDFVEIVDF